MQLIAFESQIYVCNLAPAARLLFADEAPLEFPIEYADPSLNPYEVINSCAAVSESPDTSGIATIPLP